LRRAEARRLPALLPDARGRQGRRDGAPARARGGDGGLLAPAPSGGAAGRVPRDGPPARARAGASGAPGPLACRRRARRGLRAGAAQVSEARVIEVLPIETRVGAPATEEWRALNQRARAGTMFLGPDWLEPWWNHFGKGR